MPLLSFDIYQLKRCVNIDFFRNKIKFNPKNLLAKPSFNASVSLNVIMLNDNRSFHASDYEKWFSTTIVSFCGWKTFKSSSSRFLVVGAGKTWGVKLPGLSRSKSFYWLIMDVGDALNSVMNSMRKQAA